MGTMDGSDVRLEIEKIAESKINVLDARGLLIATFTSGVSPKELTDWFKLNKRNFLLFDLNEENSGFNVTKKDIHEGLFGFLKEMSNKDLEDKTVEFLKDIEMTSDTKNFTSFVKQNRKKEKVKKITKEDVKKMTIKEKQELQDSIIDNGVENMTEYDKEILSFLWL
jgi:hypothetical protein